MLELCFGGYRVTTAKTVLRMLSQLSRERVTQVDRLQQLSRKDIQHLMTLGEEAGLILGEEVELAVRERETLEITVRFPF